jgi:dephospho-CoA kinase
MPTCCRARWSDRARLGEIVFDDAGARRDLEAIIHPEVRAAIERFFAALPPGTPLAVADIPLLFETGRERDFDIVIAAVCDEAMQIDRVIKRDRLSREQAERRVRAQLPTEQKARRADFVIRTDGTFEETDQQIRTVVERLRRG